MSPTRDVDRRPEAARRAYDRIARVYAGDEPAEEDPALREACRSLFAERLAGKRVLEVGCGPGVDAWRLAERGLDVLATDISPELVAVVQERFPALAARTLDMTEPDLPEGSFDGIYAFASFLHVPRELGGRTLDRLGRLLAPGGVIFLGLCRSSKHAEYVLPEWGGMPDNPLLFTCYGEQEMAALLAEAGFAEVELFHLTSPVYAAMPRLVERGVALYQVLARKMAGR